VINETPPIILSPAEADLIRTLRPNMKVFRPGFAGHAYSFDPMNEQAPKRAPSIPEAVVHGLVERGLMVVVQGATEPRFPPIACMSTSEGERARRELKDPASRRVRVAQ
jgi:hypothetical protein